MLVNLKYGVSQVVRGKVNVVSGIFLEITTFSFRSIGNLNTDKNNNKKPSRDRFPFFPKVYRIVRTEKGILILEEGTW